MRLPDFDLTGPASTFWAVFLGAFLATIGALIAGQVEDVFRRRGAERHAALLFGEVLATLGVLLRIVEEVKGYGDPYGPVTIRMLRSARREVEVYDRNRETLYILRDGDLRVRLHTSILRLTMPLEGVIEGHEAILAHQAALKTAKDAERAELERLIAEEVERREQGFAFVMDQRERLSELTKELGRIARHDFRATRAVTTAG